MDKIGELRRFVESTSPQEYLDRLRLDRKQLKLPGVLRGFFLVFAAIWLAGTGTPFVGGVRDAAREASFQLKARPVPAKIERSRVDGKMVALDLSYEVAGQVHKSKERMPADDPRLGKPASELVGVTLQVFVDPRVPGAARLSLDPEDSFRLSSTIFLGPFLAVGLLILRLAVTGELGLWLARPMGFLAVYTPLSAASAFVLFAAGMFAPPRPVWLVGAGMLVLYPIVAWVAAGLCVRHFFGKFRKKARAALAIAEHVSPLVNPSPRPAAPGDPPTPAVTADPEPISSVTSGVALGVPATQLHPESIWNISRPRGQRVGMVFMLFFTVGWCGITGVFVGIVVNSFYMYAKVKATYATTDGKVVSGELKSHDGDDSTTYSAKIVYTYTVNGQSYTSDRYAYGSGSSSERGYHQGLVAQYPPGKSVTVYYDPAKPSESVLSAQVEPMMYFLILFLQPFILVGLGMVAGTVWVPFHRRTVRRFLDRPVQVPVRIPTWGDLREDLRGISIFRRGTLKDFLVGLVVGYGAATFVSIFVVGFAFQGFGSPNLTAIAVAFVLAVLVGVTAGVFYLRSQQRKARVTIDQGLQQLTVTSDKRQEQVPLAQLGAWLLRMVPNPRKVKQEGAPAEVPFLSALTTGGQEVPIHIFEANAEAPAIARRAAECLVEVTGRPVRFVESVPPSVTEQIIRGVGQARDMASDAKSGVDDLT